MKSSSSQTPSRMSPAQVEAMVKRDRNRLIMMTVAALMLGAAYFGTRLVGDRAQREEDLLKPELEGRLRFRFVFQEVEAPFALAIGELTEGDLHVARRQVDAAITKWLECLTTGKWPGYPKHVQRIELPPWAHREWLDREQEDSP